jgi:hypothetical protein
MGSGKIIGSVSIMPDAIAIVLYPSDKAIPANKADGFTAAIGGPII